jgi:tight adherence protein B
MANRVQSDDLDLVVTAIAVQYELGGNLAKVLDTIGDTIRERIRILREVRVLTAQQRLTGYILALLPVCLVIGLALLQPGYFDPFFEPGPARFLPVIAVAMMGVGFVLVRRIVDIEV